jgi:hypothetical protein
VCGRSAGSLAPLPRLRIIAPLLALLAALALAACGSSGSSGDARGLIRSTFGNAGKVQSGQISLLLNVQTSGLKSLTGPVQLRFGGPFDKPAKDNAPRFAFTLTGALAGRSFTAGATSTGAAGFVALSGKEYALPPAQFAAFKKSFSSVQDIAQPRTSSSGDIAWLTDPKVDGDADVSGTTTTHVSAGIDVARLLDQLENRGAGKQKLTPAQRQGVIDVVKNARFDFYTGKSDKVLRRVRIAFRLDVPAAKQAGFGGLKSADVTLDYSIADLNRPQTITAPKVTGTAAELNQKIGSLLRQLSALEALAGGNTTGTGTGTGTGTTGSASPGQLRFQRYQVCLTQAAGNNAAVKKCLALLQAP